MPALGLAAVGQVIEFRPAKSDPFLPLKHKSPDVRFAAFTGLGK
jgi:hypothetical protein